MSESTPETTPATAAHFPVLSGPPHTICSKCRTRWPCEAEVQRLIGRAGDTLRKEGPSVR